MASRNAKTGAMFSESVWGLLGAILIDMGVETGIGACQGPYLPYILVFVLACLHAADGDTSWSRRV